MEDRKYFKPQHPLLYSLIVFHDTCMYSIPQMEVAHLFPSNNHGYHGLLRTSMRHIWLNFHGRGRNNMRHVETYSRLKKSIKKWYDSFRQFVFQYFQCDAYKISHGPNHAQPYWMICLIVPFSGFHREHYLPIITTEHQKTGCKFCSNFQHGGNLNNFHRLSLTEGPVWMHWTHVNHGIFFICVSGC